MTPAIKRSELGTWYPPGERQTIMALRLAAKHGSSSKALAAMNRDLERWQNHPAEIDPRILYNLQRTRDILRFWHVADLEASPGRG